MNDMVPFGEIKQMADALGRGKMFGKTAEELLPLMLIAQAEHKHPAIAAQEYDIIQGRPAINSRSSLARFQAAGGRIQWGERSDTACTAAFSHPQGGELTITWTMDRARLAGLTGKDSWRKYPAQMLAARVVAEGVRAVYPACLSGLYTVEEVQDMPPLVVPQTRKTENDIDCSRDVTPERADTPLDWNPCPEAPKLQEKLDELKNLLEDNKSKWSDYENVMEKNKAWSHEHLVVADVEKRIESYKKILESLENKESLEAPKSDDPVVLDLGVK